MTISSYKLRSFYETHTVSSHNQSFLSLNLPGLNRTHKLDRIYGSPNTGKDQLHHVAYFLEI